MDSQVTRRGTGTPPIEKRYQVTQCGEGSARDSRIFGSWVFYLLFTLSSVLCTLYLVWRTLLLTRIPESSVIRDHLSSSSSEV